MGIAIAPTIDPRAASFVAKQGKLLINNRWVNAASGKTFKTYNPATGEVLATLAEELDLNENLAELDLPLLLIFDEDWEFQGQWGPHPQEAERYLEEWFERNPAYETLAEADTPVAQKNYAALLEELTHEMRVWYNTDLNYACAQEVHELLASLIEEGEPEEQNNG